MSYWKVLVPTATKNYIANPSWELGTDGMTAYATGTASGTRARSTAWQSRGVYSLAVTKSAGAGTDDYGFYVEVAHASEFGAGDVAVFSVDVKTNDAVSITVALSSDVGAGEATFTGPTEERRIVTATMTGAPSYIRAYVYITSGSGTIYVDGLQVEKTVDTLYCDGDQDGCLWTGGAHASPSTRGARSRAGGRWLDLDDVEFYVEETYGIGFPPLSHIVQQQALLPGALYVDAKVNERALTLVGTLVGTSRANLHSRRQQLIDLFKPDAGEGPIVLGYTGTGRWTLIDVRYDSGLTLEELDGFSERIMLRLIAYDPFWREAVTRGSTLEPNQALADADSIIRRVDGEWKALSGGFSAGGTIRAIMPYGAYMAVGGDFTSVDGDACYGSALWDPVAEDWVVIDTDTDGDGVLCMAYWTGKLTVGGSFTQKDSVADTGYLAKYDEPTDTWLKVLSTGPDDVVRCMAVNIDNSLVIGGDFLNVAGGARYRLTRIYGSTPVDLGLNGVLATLTPLTLACGPDGAIYVSGSTSAGNGPPVYKISGSTGLTAGTWTSLGGTTPTSAEIYTLVMGPDGYLYAGGDFTTLGSGGPYLARWVGGSVWESLGIPDGPVHAIWFDKTGLMYVAGEFTEIDGLSTPDGVAIWNGYTWSSLGTSLPGTPVVRAFAEDDAGTLYLGYNTTGSASTSVKTSVTIDSSRTEYPKLTIRRTDTDDADSVNVQLIRNRTTGATLYLNYDMAVGETLTIDLKPGARTVRSNLHGQVWRAIQRNSDVAAWNLLPGTNELETYAATSGSADVEIALTYVPTHWSADGLADEISWFV